MYKKIIICLSIIILLNGCGKKDSFTLSKNEITIDAYSTFEPSDYLLKNNKKLSKEDKKKLNIKNDTDIKKPGRYQVIFEDYNLTLKVIVKDEEKPVLTIQDYTLTQNDTFDKSLLKISMKDNVTKEEDLNKTLQCDRLDTSTTGIKTITCSIQDESKNKTETKVNITIKEKETADIDKKTDSPSKPNVENKPNEPNKPSVPNKPVEPEKPVADDTYQVFLLVNEERRKAGLSELTYASGNLAKAAQIRADEITQVFSHTRPNGKVCFSVLYEFNIYPNAAGENIAKGYPTPEAVMIGWMNSKGHRENILNPNFNTVAVGKKGTHWVQIFARI